MSKFYKMDPSLWDNGTAQLSLEQEAAYLRIVNAIHKHDGPVPHNDRVLAGMFRVSMRKARSILDALISAGKITIEDGFIWNERARSDMVQRGFVTISRVESGAKGGRKSAEVRAKVLENKDAGQANAFARRIEENRIDTEANASDADASSPSLKEQVWSRGVRFLVARGIADRQARSVIGLWLKDHSDGEVFDAFIAADKERPVEPVAWITARLGKPSQRSELDAAFAQLGERMAAQ